LGRRLNPGGRYEFSTVVGVVGSPRHRSTSELYPNNVNPAAGLGPYVGVFEAIGGADGGNTTAQDILGSVTFSVQVTGSTASVPEPSSWELLVCRHRAACLAQEWNTSPHRADARLLARNNQGSRFMDERFHGFSLSDSLLPSRLGFSSDTSSSIPMRVAYSPSRCF
jgi:hypothetical protein